MGFRATEASKGTLTPACGSKLSVILSMYEDFGIVRHASPVNHTFKGGWSGSKVRRFSRRRPPAILVAEGS